MSLYMQVIILNDFIVLFPVGLEIGSDDTKGSVNLTEFLLSLDAEIKPLAVLDVVVNGRFE